MRKFFGKYRFNLVDVFYFMVASKGVTMYPDDFAKQMAWFALATLVLVPISVWCQYPLYKRDK